MNKEIQAKFDRLPRFVRDEFNREFENHLECQKIQEAIEVANRANQYVTVLQLRQKLDKIKEGTIRDLLESENSEVKILKSTDLGLTQKEIDEVNELQIALYMLCDVMDSIILDMNSLLKKKDKDVSFEMFDDIKELGKRVKERINYVEREMDLIEDGELYDNSDNLYQMLLTKSRKTYNIYKERKLKKSKEQVNEIL